MVKAGERHPTLSLFVKERDVRLSARPLCPSDISPASGGNPSLPLWMDVPSAEAPAFAGVTDVYCFGATEADFGRSIGCEYPFRRSSVVPIAIGFR